MENQQDEIIDNFIRSEIGTRVVSYRPLEPSADFVAKTMTRIHGLDQQRRRTALMVAAVLFALPLAARETWFYFRGDYFSVTSMPLGNLVADVYGRFFIAPLGLYVGLVLGVAVSLYYFSKSRKGSSQQLIKIA